MINNRKKQRDIISIIMGVYNAEKTLCEAIDSIIYQTFTNWEMIICDDASTDESFSIAKWYSKKDPRIIVIKNKKNHGLGYSLNHCLKMASGSFIARMDADDISMPSRLEKEYTFLRNHDEISIVSSAITLFNEDGDIKTKVGIKEPGPLDFITGTPVAHAPCMMRKRCLDEVGGYSEDRKTLRVEDADLWIRFCLKGYKFYNIEESLYKVRFNKDAVQRQKMIYRWNAAGVTFKACRSMQLPLKYYKYAFRPILIGVIPSNIRYWLHKKKKE